MPASVARPRASRWSSCRRCSRSRSSGARRRATRSASCASRDRAVSARSRSSIRSASSGSGLGCSSAATCSARPSSACSRTRGCGPGKRWRWSGGATSATRPSSSSRPWLAASSSSRRRLGSTARSTCATRYATTSRRGSLSPGSRHAAGRCSRVRTPVGSRRATGTTGAIAGSTARPRGWAWGAPGRTTCGTRSRRCSSARARRRSSSWPNSLGTRRRRRSRPTRMSSRSIGAGLACPPTTW